MIKLINLIKEISWVPNSTFDNYLMDSKDLENKNVISQFVEYHGLPKLINDVWEYANSNAGLYPKKLTTRGIVYYPKNRTKIEIEFTKDGRLVLYQFNDVDRLIKNAKFSFDIFKKMTE